MWVLHVLHESGFEMLAAPFLLHTFASTVRIPDAIFYSLVFVVAVVMTSAGDEPHTDVDSPPQWSHRMEPVIKQSQLSKQNQTQQNRTDRYHPTSCSLNFLTPSLHTAPHPVMLTLFHDLHDVMEAPAGDFQEKNANTTWQLKQCL